MFPMEASQIFASGAVVAEDGAAEEEVIAIDVEEETTALELVTTEEVAVEVLALEEVTNVLVILEVDIEEVVGCDGLDKDAIEETIG